MQSRRPLNSFEDEDEVLNKKPPPKQLTLKIKHEKSLVQFDDYNLIKTRSKKRLIERGELTAPCFAGAETELAMPEFISCKQVVN